MPSYTARAAIEPESQSHGLVGEWRRQGVDIRIQEGGYTLDEVLDRLPTFLSEGTWYVPAKAQISTAGGNDVVYHAGMWWRILWGPRALPGQSPQVPGPPLPPGRDLPPAPNNGGYNLPVPEPYIPNPNPMPPPAVAQRDYDRGYEDGRAGRVAPEYQGPPPAPTPWDRFYYDMGRDDGRAGRPRVDLARGAPPPRPAERPPGPGTPPVPTPPWVPVPPRQAWDPGVSYEVCAYWPLLSEAVQDQLGKAAPYDWAVKGGLLIRGFHFVLLGDDPADWGPKPRGRGFRLSGPGGMAVRLAAQRMPGQSPQAHGLPAWICTMTRTGPRLLSRAAMDRVFLPGWAG